MTFMNTYEPITTPQAKQPEQCKAKSKRNTTNPKSTNPETILSREETNP